MVKFKENSETAKHAVQRWCITIGGSAIVLFSILGIFAGLFRIDFGNITYAKKACTTKFSDDIVFQHIVLYDGNDEDKMVTDRISIRGTLKDKGVNMEVYCLYDAENAKLLDSSITPLLFE